MTRSWWARAASRLRSVRQDAPAHQITEALFQLCEVGSTTVAVRLTRGHALPFPPTLAWASALGEEERYALVKLAEPRREVDNLRILIAELAGKPAAT